MTFPGLFRRWLRREGRETPPAVQVGRGIATPDSYASPAAQAARDAERGRRRRQDFPFVYVPGEEEISLDVRALRPQDGQGTTFNHDHRRRISGVWAEDTLLLDPPPPDDYYYLDLSFSIWSAADGRAFGILPTADVEYSMKFLRRNAGVAESWDVVNAANGLDNIDINPLYYRAVDVRADGRIFIVWSSGNDQRIRLIYSDDGGNSWSPPQATGVGFPGNNGGTVVVRGDSLLAYTRNIGPSPPVGTYLYVWDLGWQPYVRVLDWAPEMAARAADHSAQSLMYVKGTVFPGTYCYRKVVGDDGALGAEEEIMDAAFGIGPHIRAHYYDEQHRPVALVMDVPSGAGRKKVRGTSGWPTDHEAFDGTDPENVDALFCRLGVEWTDPRAYVVTLIPVGGGGRRGIPPY